MFSGGAISWSSRKQKCVALSTAEDEYVALICQVQFKNVSGLDNWKQS